MTAPSRRTKSIGCVILGGTGYGAGELLRLLVAHPHAEVISVLSQSQAGERIADTHRFLAGINDLKFESAINWNTLGDFERAVIFSSLPHQTSSRTLRALVAESSVPDLKLIDLSGDLRLRDESVHSQTYPEVEFDREFRSQFCFALPELNRKEISSARHISNPGCLSTASILTALPLTKLESKLRITFDAKTGTSGAGRNPQASIHHPTRHGNFEAYKILEHRHEAEIRQALGDISGANIQTMFVPHLLPVSRGIFVTTYVTLSDPISETTLFELYESFYKSSPFIRMRSQSPTLHDVVGTNFCDITLRARGTQLVIMAALDNLGKGMAGQAIQNMNIALHLEETSGLLTPSLGIF